jgi:hypothetical protein
VQRGRIRIPDHQTLTNPGQVRERMQKSKRVYCSSIADSLVSVFVRKWTGMTTIAGLLRSHCPIMSADAQFLLGRIDVMKNRWLFVLGFGASKVLQYASATAFQGSSAAQHVKLTSLLVRIADCRRVWEQADISQFVCGWLPSYLCHAVGWPI